MLSVKVPADAKVFVNDRPTTSTGTDREYISRDLQSGARYNYDIRAEFLRDGQTVSEVKTVQLTAGQSVNLDFNGASEDLQAANDMGDSLTTLTVRLPADAKLYLGGHRDPGHRRRSASSRRASCRRRATWTTYAIRATIGAMASKRSARSRSR